MEQVNENIKISVENFSGEKVTIELPWDATAYEVVRSMYAAMLGITYFPESIYDGMREFLDTYDPQIDCNGKED